MLDFKGGDDKQIMELPIYKSVIFEPNVSTFNGVESVKGFVRNIVPDYTDLSGVSLDILENELKKITVEKPTEVKTAGDIDLTHNSYGTIYIASDEANAKKYQKLKNLPVYLFTPPKSGESCIVVSPEYIPETYIKSVYLDKPFAYLDAVSDNSCFFDNDGRVFAKKLDTDRDTFAKCFAEIRALSGRFIKSGAAFYRSFGASANVSGENFVFSYLVFCELGFFKEEKGRFVFDSSVKKPLSESEIYRRVCQYKGELC